MCLFSLLLSIYCFFYLLFLLQNFKYIQCHAWYFTVSFVCILIRMAVCPKGRLWHNSLVCDVAEVAILVPEVSNGNNPHEDYEFYWKAAVKKNIIY